MLDRIDIHTSSPCFWGIEVPRVDYKKLCGDRLGESSESIRARVQDARNIQQLRFTNCQSDIICNADMRVGEIRQFCKLQDEGQSLMRAAMSQMNLSARAYHRTRSVKLARTIADLTGSEDIQSAHLAEALHASQPSEINDGIKQKDLDFVQVDQLHFHGGEHSLCTVGLFQLFKDVLCVTSDRLFADT